MDVLLWLQTQDDLSATIGFYVELARKFLSETKLFAARFLLTDFMEQNFGNQRMLKIKEKENRSKLIVTENQGNLLIKAGDSNF